MRSKELKTSRFVHMLILSMILSIWYKVVLFNGWCLRVWSR